MHFDDTKNLNKNSSASLSHIPSIHSTTSKKNKTTSVNFSKREHPKFIGYMGCKTKLLDPIIQALNDVYQGGAICDLFSGSGTLAGALGNQCQMIANDIQHYSTILSDFYLNAWRYPSIPSAEKIIHETEEIVKKNLNCLCKKFGLKVDYTNINSAEQLLKIEEKQRLLIHESFDHEYHLFLKYFSGTWWSAEQCVWIDAIRAVVDQYQHQPCFDVIFCALLFAITYANPGIGHRYSFYREPSSDIAFKEMIACRKRSIADLFIKKYNQILIWLPPHPSSHKNIITTLDYYECLQTFKGGVVYADPPYSASQYSNSYHILETLVRYDYPAIQKKKDGRFTKARYRQNKHRSPFALKSQVKTAFQKLFFGVLNNGSDLVLSYSNTGLLPIDELIHLARQILNTACIEVRELKHTHSAMGFNGGKPKKVKEYLILSRQR